jgi:mRNA-degrading endonuclease RelE of RelBE toxin-antitoxin system
VQGRLEQTIAEFRTAIRLKSDDAEAHFNLGLALRAQGSARDHLGQLRRRDQRIIVGAVEVNLSNEPDHQTRRRKKLADKVFAPWELRVANFRVFYDVHREDRRVVVIAIGQKTHNRLVVGGEEIEL